MKKRQTLRTGYTTGTCAAVAARGALLCLLGGETGKITVQLPCGDIACIVPEQSSRTDDSGICRVVKDAGDDPDITNGTVISATVKLLSGKMIIIKGGAGVGVVTRPGLAVPPGEAAINPVPRTMIRTALEDILPHGQGAEVIISVARGRELAEKTLNPRLGIVGGISILGTTGLVVPYSHTAYRESIVCALDVARAMGLETIVFSTGKSSEQVAKKVFAEIAEPGFILIADYFSFAVKEAVRHDIKKIILACFPGKLLKIASGAACTHYSKSSIDLAMLADIAQQASISRTQVNAISRANTVRHAFSLMPADQIKRLCSQLSMRAIKRIHSETNGQVSAEVLILAYTNEILYNSKQ